MRIAFVWDSLHTYYGTRFNDGLYLALKRLEERHAIGYFEPQEDDLIAAFRPDVVLFWGALCGHETPHVKQMPYRKAICFAGGPIDANTVDGFDLYFTESRWNEDEFDRFGKPWMRAFGINELIFRPIRAEKKYDAAIWATFALWKRHNLFADAVGEKGLAIGLFQDHERQCYEWCQAKGMEVRGEMPKEEMVKLLAQSHVALNTSAFWGGGQRMTLEAMAMEIPVVVMADSPKNREYVEECGLGLVAPPEVGPIRDAVRELKGKRYHTRDYIMSKYTSQHYADALEKGLTQL